MHFNSGNHHGNQTNLFWQCHDALHTALTTTLAPAAGVSVSAVIMSVPAPLSGCVVHLQGSAKEQAHDRPFA